MTTQRGQNKFVEVNKSDFYNRILELDFQKMEKRHERHIWHIKSMWGGVAGILLAVYVVTHVTILERQRQFSCEATTIY